MNEYASVVDSGQEFPQGGLSKREGFVTDRKRKRKYIPLKATLKAINRMSDLIHDRDKDKTFGIKIKIEKGGCAGFKYKFEFINNNDIKNINSCEVISFCSHSDFVVNVLIDPAAIMKLFGATIDYQEDEIKKRFVFINPNETGSCGCGESFNV